MNCIRGTYLVQEVDNLIKEVGAFAVLQLFFVEDLGLLDKLAFIEVRVSVTVLGRLVEVVVSAATFSYLSFNHIWLKEFFHY